MNKLTNDLGEIVDQIGSEGSIARIKCQYPKALKRCEELFFAGNYSNLGRSSAYNDAMNELYELYPSDIVHSILQASIFHEKVEAEFE